MDMPTPDGLATAPDAAVNAMLTRLAQALDCSPDRFFDAAPTGKAKDTSHLIQIWLAIKEPENRAMVFAFADEVLRSEARKARRDGGA